MGLTNNLGKLSNMITSTGSAVGIGTSSITNGTTWGGGLQTNLLKLSASGYPALEINTTSDGGGSIQFTYGTNLPNQVRGFIGYNSGGGAVNEFYLYNSASGPLVFVTNATEKMRITSAGNVGIGTSTQWGLSGYTAIEFGNYGLLYASTSSGTSTTLANNLYHNGSNWIYKNTQAGSLIGQGSGSITFETAASGTAGATASISEKMRLTNAGNLGIGTSSPNGKLNVSNGGAEGIEFWVVSATATNLMQSYNRSTSAWNSLEYKALDHIFYGSGSERMRITSAGNVGIGTASPDNTANYTTLDVRGASGGIIQSSNGSQKVQLYSTGSGTYAGAASNDFFGFITNGSERARITNAGKLLVRTTTSTAGGGGDRVIELDGNIYSKGSDSGYFWTDRSNSANFYGWYATSNVVYFFNGSANAASITPSTGVYTPLSDVNKKKDFEDSTIGLNAILGLKPTLYRMKSDDTQGNKELGFIAQEVKEFIPEAFVQSEDFIGLNYNAITATLVKAIQEQQAQIEELKAKIK
jgi:hypothetical protein